MSAVFSVLYVLTLIFFILMMIRLVFEWIQVFARDWRPSGPVLVVADAAFSVTAPPIKLVRRVIPPLRIGRVALDLGFLVVVVACSFLMRIFATLAVA